jgi:hypothetical protein
MEERSLLVVGNDRSLISPLWDKLARTSPTRYTSGREVLSVCWRVDTVKCEDSIDIFIGLFYKVKSRRDFVEFGRFKTINTGKAKYFI